MTSRRWAYVAVTLVLLFVAGFTVMQLNVLNMGDRFERLQSRVMLFLDPPPDRLTLPTVVVTPRPSATARPTAAPTMEPLATASPSPTPLVREPVDVDLVDDHEAVFASQIGDRDCAVAATQIVLAILGLGDNSDEFQAEIRGRIDDWESLEDSHDGDWGPAAVGLALADYGAPGYEVRAYESYTDALRDSATAISETGKPVVMFPWWGAHSWVMTGYRADADPTLFADAHISGAYILDPWYPRISSIWGESDEPGNFEDLAELERNWPVYRSPPGYEQVPTGWTRPGGVYPLRDGKFVVLLPTTPRTATGS